MRALVLWAEPHSTNLGVRALGEGSAALLDRAWPGIEVAVQGYGEGDAPVRIGNVRRVGREWVLRSGELVQWLRGFDVVLDTRAGDSFADIYGLTRLVQMSAVTELVRRARVPLVMGPQTIGPFSSRRGRLVARRVLSTATCVMSRDPVSAAAAADLGRRVDVRTTDVVFALPRPAPGPSRDVVLNPSGLLWADNPHTDAARYRDLVVALCTALQARGRTVSLLPHVLASPLADNDEPAARELAAVLGPQVEVVVPRSLQDARAVLAGARVTVGSRMHACLNSLSVGTPAVALAYSRKFQPLMAELGWPHTVDLRGPDVGVEEVLTALDAAESAGKVTGDSTGDSPGGAVDTGGVPGVLAAARDLVDNAVAGLRSVL